MRIIAHGVDLVEVARIAAMLDAYGPRFVERCFTDAERVYADSGRRRRPERYAARFACKEAVMKALGTGWSSGMSWRDIAVDRRPSGQPTLVLSGRAAELAAHLSIVRWHVSLSHTGGSALASVLGCG
ncbi:MAG: holo-ACP synthase [Planctomycetota bacterium]